MNQISSEEKHGWVLNDDTELENQLECTKAVTSLSTTSKSQHTKYSKANVDIGRGTIKRARIAAHSMMWRGEKLVDSTQHQKELEKFR